MTTFLLLIVYGVLGFAGHLTERFTTANMASIEWKPLCNYGLGVTYVFPLAAFLMHHLKQDIPNVMLRFTVSFWFAFISFGMGVTAGHRYHKFRR